MHCFALLLQIARADAVNVRDHRQDGDAWNARLQHVQPLRSALADILEGTVRPIEEQIHGPRHEKELEKFPVDLLSSDILDSKRNLLAVQVLCRPDRRIHADRPRVLPDFGCSVSLLILDRFLYACFARFAVPKQDNGHGAVGRSVLFTVTQELHGLFAALLRHLDGR